MGDFIDPTATSVGLQTSDTQLAETQGDTQTDTQNNAYTIPSSIMLTPVSSATPNYLQLALTSVTSMFSGSKTALASGISAGLTDIFKDTNVASASTPTSKISDPIATNLLTKTPASSGFTVGSLSGGSQSLTLKGSNSTTGTDADKMTGVILSTLLGRFSLDSPSNLSSTLSNSLTKTKTTALFTTLSKSTGSIVSNELGGGALGSLVGIVAAQATATGLGVTTTASLKTSLTNDLNRYLGTSSNVSQALGGTNTASFFQPTTSYSLLTENNVPVSTNKSGVSSTLANALVAIIKESGCVPTNNYYTSATERSSLYNLSLTTAALNGMATEVGDLLGCTHASTTAGQTSLTSAFLLSSNSQLDISHSILQSIDSPYLLNVPDVTSSIITNPNLSAYDVPTIDLMMQTMGSTTTNALTIASASSSDYPVYDAGLLASSSSSFVNGYMGDSTVTDCFAGSVMDLTSDGSFGIGL